MRTASVMWPSPTHAGSRARLGRGDLPRGDRRRGPRKQRFWLRPAFPDSRVSPHIRGVESARQDAASVIELGVRARSTLIVQHRSLRRFRTLGSDIRDGILGRSTPTRPPNLAANRRILPLALTPQPVSVQIVTTVCGLAEANVADAFAASHHPILTSFERGHKFPPPWGWLGVARQTNTC